MAAQNHPPAFEPGFRHHNFVRHVDIFEAAPDQIKDSGIARSAEGQRAQIWPSQSVARILRCGADNFDHWHAKRHEFRHHRQHVIGRAITA